MKYTILDQISWHQFQQNYTKEQIIDYIFNEIRQKNLPIPVAKPDVKEAISGFEKLKSTSYKDLLKEDKHKLFSRYEYETPFSHRFVDINYDGLKSSGYFNYEERMACDSVNSPGPQRTWSTDRFLLTLLNSIFTLKPKCIDSVFLASAMSLRKYVASQFRPSAAKCVYEIFNANHIYDFSGGWGDRLVAALATESVKSYTCVDPNTNMFKKYRFINDMFNKGKETEFFNLCAEDDELKEKLKNKKFDLVFTSPPYFNAERYTQDETQSFKRYKQLDSWLENFLFKSLQTAWDHLEIGGHMVINISDIYSGHKINKICDSMHKFITENLDGCEFVELMGYKLNKRIKSKADKDGTFVEPMWVYKKI